MAALRECANTFRSPNGFLMASFLVLGAATLTLEWLSVSRGNEPYCFVRRPGVLITLAILTVLLAPVQSNGFIYFAF
jgi:hypothetical protein